MPDLVTHAQGTRHPRHTCAHHYMHNHIANSTHTPESVMHSHRSSAPKHCNLVVCQSPAPSFILCSLQLPPQHRPAIHVNRNPIFCLNTQCLVLCDFRATLHNSQSNRWRTSQQAGMQLVPLRGYTCRLLTASSY
jgi:hypothetical protein